MKTSSFFCCFLVFSLVICEVVFGKPALPVFTNCNEWMEKYGEKANQPIPTDVPRWMKLRQRKINDYWFYCMLMGPEDDENVDYLNK